MIFFQEKVIKDNRKLCSDYLENMENENKTRTSKVGAISKAQKAQNIFLEKIVIFEKKFFQKKSHSAGKNPKGDPLGTSGFVGNV